MVARGRELIDWLASSEELAPVVEAALKDSDVPGRGDTVMVRVRISVVLVTEVLVASSEEAALRREVTALRTDSTGVGLPALMPLEAVADPV
jgi:hypothetical protein